MSSPDGAEATSRLVAKLNNPRAVFNREQLAFLMAESARWARESIEEVPSELSWRAGFEAGYWARVAEENDAYPPQPYGVMTSAGRDAVEVHRIRVGIDQRYVRPEDFQGAAG